MNIDIPNWVKPPKPPTKGKTMLDEETVAQSLYEKYCQEVGGKAFNGDPLPTWEEFSTDPTKTTQANGWRAAAKRAFELFLGA